MDKRKVGAVMDELEEIVVSRIKVECGLCKYSDEFIWDKFKGSLYAQSMLFDLRCRIVKNKILQHMLLLGQWIGGK